MPGLFLRNGFSLKIFIREIIGDENALHIAKIEEGMPGAISFLSNPKYTPYIYETQSKHCTG